LLIENGLLDFQEFKKIYKDLKWRKLPRSLNKKVKDYFYVGRYEDDKKIINIAIRPTKFMKVEETWKNRKLDGSKPPKGWAGKVCEWGTTIEVLIDDTVLDKIKKVSKTPKGGTVQKVTWS